MLKQAGLCARTNRVKKGKRVIPVFLLLLLLAVCGGFVTVGKQLEDPVLDGRTPPLVQNPQGLMLDVPYINQAERYPNGCESVSAVMALQYLGETVTVEDFIDTCLPQGDTPYLAENGELVGSDPWVQFLGNPYSEDGWGCYATVIADALKNGGYGEKYTVEELYGLPLETLCSRYVDREIPVLIWATAGMQEAREGQSWRVEGEEKTVTWISPMHCLLLVGYDEDSYIFNDSLETKGMAYPKVEVERAYGAMGEQAIVIY